MLTRTECTALRGLAIVAIALHNYCHFIGRIVQENEYQYHVQHNDRLWEILSNPDVLLPVHLLSYFGHYGVPVFLFLSGLGLVMKYEAPLNPPKGGKIGSPSLSPSKGSPSLNPSKGSPSLSPIPFLRYHYLKLLRMLVVGFVLFVFVDTMTPGRFHFHWYNVLAQLTMTINLLPTPDKIIWPGIYWFFGLMMELYMVYRLLLYRRSSWWTVGLVAVCWLLQVVCEPDGESLNRLRYNFIGGMLPFGAGILYARYGERLKMPVMRPYQWLFVSLLVFAVVFAMCFNFQTWLWIPLFIVVGSIAFVKALPSGLMNITVWLGSLSAAMFVAHPIARKLLIIVAWKDGIYDGLMLYIVVTIGMSWAVKQIIEQLEREGIREK